MINKTDFDALSRKTNESGGAAADLNNLFGAVFALPEWLFIARGVQPHVNPYIAANAAYAEGKQMVRAFTDGERLMRFARENNLTESDGSCPMLTIPTAGAIEYLEQFQQYDVHGVWFNSDTQSDGFFIPLQQLRPIKEHLAKLSKSQNRAKKTVLLIVHDGLGFPSGFVSESDYVCNLFCRVPESWTEGDKLKPEYWERFYEKFYGAGWRNGNSDGSQFVVRDAFSTVFDVQTVKNTRWEGTTNTNENHYWFYLVGEDGEVVSVKEEEFQADIDAELKSAASDEARAQQDRLAGFGMSQTPDGDFDINLSINRVGAVNFETSIAPFYQAIVPLLLDFQGTGEFVSLLAFDPSAMSNLAEDVSNNIHGAYLRIRGFLYLNPKNNVRISVSSIHSNRLRHIRSNAELIVSIELCKNLDNQTAALYHRFEGPKSDVLKLAAAIQPALEACGYQAVSG